MFLEVSARRHVVVVTVAVIVVSAEIRLPLKRFFESSFPRVAVLAYQELPPATEIENAGIITAPAHVARAEVPLKAAA